MERIQSQAQNQKQTTSQGTDEIQLATTTTDINHQAVSEIDDLLAEIDGVLEENAEDFVKGFVQKGGQ
ncbi:ubiquitin-like protein Pup [Rothia sp. CCM 9417]|uniref:ubiquitin-like protein Pup n=1 Tax=unclassified Rothia (in: high G+C Gram-positive bacteria) TaxID=2689056 RepID=UPI003AED780A